VKRAATCSLLVWLVLTGGFTVAVASAAVYTITPELKTTLVTFISKAPMETIEGKTKAMKGTIVADLAQLTDSVTVAVEVDLTQLKTGIGKRDAHMRENHLETEQYPTATFRGGRIIDRSADLVTSDQPVTCRVEGELTLHGITRKLEADLELRLIGEDLWFKASFTVTLADFKIKRPKFLIMKLSEEQKITVEAVAVQIDR
jgi:polyisoprenoid-binding protein YceI